MGALHRGHAELLKRGRRAGDVLVLSVFVNPTQFGPREDFRKYPRTLRADLKIARSCGVDIVFFPNAASIYPEGYKTHVEVSDLTRELCGKSRPGHFRGVATVVLKLFNLVQPDVALFGLKDFQQCAVIKKMVKDLDLPVKIVGVPTVRDRDGVALSSRNAYLSAEERGAARSLSRSLFRVRREVQRGARDLSALLRKIRSEIVSTRGGRVDYVSCVDAEEITPLKKYRPRRTLFAVAAYFGKTRLIDNLVV